MTVNYLFNVFKRTSSTALIGLLLLATASFSATATTSPEQLTSAPTTSILVLGDSISAAFGIPRQKGWVALLDQHLKQQQPQRKFVLINASISGETTVGGLSRLPKLLAQYQPDIVIIELGANDGLRGFPIKNIRTNLEQLVKLSQGANAKVLLTGMHIPPNYGARYTRLLHDSYSLIATRYQTALLPFLLEGIAIYPELMQEDGLHPTAEAQPRILQNVLPHLKGIL